MSETRLKYVAETQAGGTPSVANPAFWSDDGTPWVAIADMTRDRLVHTTERHVSDLGIDERRLPIGEPGTLLFAMYASVGETAVLTMRGTWNQAILGITPRADLSDIRFVNYWLQHLRPQLLGAARSNTQANLNAEQVQNLPFPALSVLTQRRIADFLDAETSRIDALITAKQQMIEVASARYRATVISDLVEIPTAPLKRSASLVDCKHRTPTYVAEGYPVVSPGDVTAGALDLPRCHRFVTEADWLDLADGPRRPKVGDIVYSRNASVGLAALVAGDEDFCMGQDVCLVRPHRDDGNGRFLAHVLNNVGLDQIDRLKVGSTFFRINVEQIAELEVPVADEGRQDEFVSQWDAELDWVLCLVLTLTRQIELLRERRQALITAAVSGELDVA